LQSFGKGDLKKLNISISAKYVDGKEVNYSKMEDFVHELFWRAIIRLSNLILEYMEGCPMEDLTHKVPFKRLQGHLLCIKEW
jgi:hypothetical protein